MYYSCGISDIGNTRTHNEDSFLINHIVMSHAQMESSLSQPFIVAVADGVAGERTGHIASKLTLQKLSDVNISTPSNLKKEILSIHTHLCNYGLCHNSSLNMQSTLCALAVDAGNNAYSINVGDSRMYRLRQGNLSQLTKDQSLVEVLWDAGKITLKEKTTHRCRNIILPVLGNLSMSPRPEIKCLGKILRGDIILICSDGLSDYVNPRQIQSILAHYTEHCNQLPILLQQLLQYALNQGSKDNITIVAVCLE